jgi:hypothetical protein
MIPKAAIEKAIQGGWQPNVSEFREFVCYIDAVNYLDAKGSWQVIKYEEIALDPSFFQALGKALGLEKSDRNTRTEIWLEWKYQAHRFYDLILTGQPTEPFWEALLK